ncbi:prepilin-type N-terminal cleavage/methylation domain-containing protein [Patescibacteria group bacterium]|nr:prepilin-type N-terminal cleavage/methylation domain-containing protein [Patescibacteria group bacterium]
MPNSTPKKGFTLIEIMIVVTLLALLSIIAMGSIINARKLFSFWGVYKKSIYTMQRTRLYAGTSHLVNGEIPEFYALQVNKSRIFIYGEIEGSSNPYLYDPETDVLIGTIAYLNNCDPLELNPQVSSFCEEREKNYSISLKEDNGYTTLGENENYLTFHYSPNSAELLSHYVRTAQDVTQISDTPYIILKIQDDTEPAQFASYIVFYTKSGVIEGFDQTSDPDLPIIFETNE